MTTTPSPAKASTDTLALDVLTIMAIGVVVFIIKNVLHEALGHGGACLLVGGVPLQLSTAYFECGYQAVSEGGVRLVAAAGTLVNFIAAFFFWLAFKNSRTQAPTLRYFLWLGMSVNYFSGAGYPLFSGLLGVGDWVDVIQRLEPAGMWRGLLVLSGLGLYGFGIWFSLHEISTLIGDHPTERLVRAFRLTLFPYLAGATAASIGALLNPLGLSLAFSSAAASFGGSSALAWMSQLLRTDKWFPEKSAQFVKIERNWVWVGVAGVLLLVHVLVLGPGIKF